MAVPPTPRSGANDSHAGSSRARTIWVSLSTERLVLRTVASASLTSPADTSLWLPRMARVSITFNGEIFNFVELRDELERKGHSFVTRSDTEVILHLYQQYGTDCVRYMNGQWAFAIWDARRRTVLHFS